VPQQASPSTTRRPCVFPAAAGICSALLFAAGCGGEEPKAAPDTTSLPVTIDAEDSASPAGAGHQAVATPSATLGPDPDLLARRELALGGRPLGLVAHDFDADGFDDLAVVLESPGEVVVFAGTRQGLAPYGHRAAVGGFPTEPVLQAGRVLVGSMASGELLRVRVERDAAGELVPQVEARSTPGGAPRLLAASSERTLWVTRDDALVLLDREGARVERQLELGARIVGAYVDDPSGRVILLGQGASEVRALDVATLGDVTSLAFPGVPRSVDAGDLDGDGDEELVVCGGDDAVWVFGLGAPGGVSMTAAPTRLTQPNLVPKGIHARDLSGDGRAELVSLGLIDQGYCVLTDVTPDLRNGGRLVVASEYAGQDPVALALGDFDGNGTVDLATACRAANAVSLWSGTGRAEAKRASFDEARRLGVGGSPLSIAAADLWGARTAEGFAERDGRPEVATLDAGDGMLSVLTNDGYGTLELAARWPVGPSPRALRSIDGPGGPALVALSVAPGRGSTLVGFRRGAVPVEVRLAAGMELPEAGEAQVAAADLDADGDTDLVLAATGRPELWLLRNVTTPDGALAFEAAAPRALPGIASALATLERGGTAYLALGIGGEVLITSVGGAPAMRIPAPPAARGGRGVGRMVEADLDGDGRGDLATLWLGSAGTSPGWLHARTLPELDKGEAVVLESVVPTGLAPQGLDAADLNADGREDLLLAAQNSHLVELWLVHPSGALFKRPSLGVGLGPMAPLAVDLIGKQLADVVVANAFSADVSIAYNRPRKDD